jgi:hypothetical protein
LRRERRALLRVREDRLRDLGGLMLEMYRRDQFRQDLLIERCDELVAIDERLQELETLLAAAASVRRPAPVARCACGAPIVAGSHFCANCGRAVGAAPPLVTCPSCGAPVGPDEVRCGYCRSRLATVACPQCLALAPAGAEHCAHCGAALAMLDMPKIAALPAPAPSPTRLDHADIGALFEFEDRSELSLIDLGLRAVAKWLG